MGTLSEQMNPDSSGGERWSSRPGLDRVVRGLVLAVPISASVAAGVAVSRLVAAPSGSLALLGWYALILASSLAVLIVVDHVARRFLPLAVLLRLSFLFPDHAPSRLSVALNAGNPRRLASYLERSADPDHPPDLETILTLAAALNAHDRRTRGHSERVRALTELLAVELRLTEVETEQLRWAGFLHDIGKLRVPPAVLNKRGQLDGREWRAIQRHPVHGEELAQPLAAWLGEWIHAIGDHHERFDGTGYPAGRAGTEISVAGRIVSVADSFETMTAVRSYNRPMTARDARAELARCAGTHFDPTVVRAFFAISLGRLRWTAGLAAWLAQLPLVGVPARAGAQVVTTAAGIEANSGSIVGAVALGLAGVATPLTPAFLAAVTWPTGPTAQAGADAGQAPGSLVAGSTGGATGSSAGALDATAPTGPVLPTVTTPPVVAAQQTIPSPAPLAPSSPGPSSGSQPPTPPPPSPTRSADSGHPSGDHGNGHVGDGGDGNHGDGNHGDGSHHGPGAEDPGQHGSHRP